MIEMYKAIEEGRQFNMRVADPDDQINLNLSDSRSSISRSIAARKAAARKKVLGVNFSNPDRARQTLIELDMEEGLY